jgi:hypothetical protein
MELYKGTVMVNLTPARDYVAELGFTPIEGRNHRGTRLAECTSCGARHSQEGSVMRSHRRRCPVAPGDPYTPAVCDS